MLKGLLGNGDAHAQETPQAQPAGWEAAYNKMHKIATAGSQTILVPKGKRPDEVWSERKDEW
jgi:ribosomal protein S5